MPIIHELYLTSLKNVLILMFYLTPSFCFQVIVTFTFPILGRVGGLVQWKLYAVRQNAAGFVLAAFSLPHCV